MKYCSNKDCKETNPQPLESFYKKATAKDGLQVRCKSCHKRHRDKYYKDHKDEIIKRTSNYLKNKTDMKKGRDIKRFWPGKTGEEALQIYNNLLQEQNFSCAICKLHMSNFKDALAVDHCHKSGKVRGLLCRFCNISLGNIKDNIETAFNMFNYLKKNN